MNYLVEYDFNNFNETFDCVPGVRNGVTFDFLDCRIKINTLGESLASFWINGEITSIEEAKSKLKEVEETKESTGQESTISQIQV